MKQSFLLLAIAGLLFSCQPKESSSEHDSHSHDSDEPSLKGAWEIIESSFSNDDTSGVAEPYRSIILFTEEFYSVEIAWEDRPTWPERPEGETVSYDDLSNAYSNLTSNSGGYSLEGDSIHFRIIVAKSPSFMNDIGKYANAIDLDGDQLTLSGRGPWGHMVNSYRRLK